MPEQKQKQGRKAAHVYFDEDALKQLKHEAVRQETSVSALVGRAIKKAGYVK